ncbi:succinate--CoA ligase subunit alpha [Desulfomicrobium baculatum]|uniref:Succinate--CoA ligase [ADP-forming] subunit alpha n=1 Tax=Desulfomicrobium baculatum (strain DSM 4028 / VKM B-1378 / X) TaxID=525897 RepID=C7LWP4_DESBD|nr:succinate--CoA ligase subunit alpha [Desulfomicrobium baculatum]ACU89927.1 succinyl-CoA synthetase, alpha subunit [Desulfomicrobium baculatum DSM 4028]
MKLNEHNSKQLFHEAGIPVPLGALLGPGDEPAPSFALPWVLKSQVLSGGRGKAGGIRMADTLEQVRTELAQIFSLTIKGEKVRLVRIEPKAAYTREIYLSITLDRQSRSFCITAGRFGGMDIESCDPQTLLIEHAAPDTGLAPFQIRNIFFHLRLPKELMKAFSSLLSNLFDCCLRHRLLLAEINPLVLTEDGQLLALDGKVEIDGHRVGIDPSLNRFFEAAHLSDEENRSREAALSYHRLDGYVGLMVNGAGLAMASMDILNYSGLEAANFLDLGGGADSTAMRTALDILFDDSRVEMVFINIFGGILSCHKVAESMLEALDGQEPRKPIVVRFAGNGSADGLSLLRKAALNGLHLCPDLTTARAALEKLKGYRPQATHKPLIAHSTAPLLPARPRETSTAFPLPENCRILVQGLTGKQGQLHCRLMQEYGANVVAGVTPGKGGSEVLGVPVFDTVREAAKAMPIDASIIFVPGAMAPDAVLEAAAAGIGWVVCITDGIPQLDMLRALERLKDSPTRVIGPNCPGLVMPGKTKIGIMPGDIFTPGPVAVFSRSGTLTYECVDRLTKAGIGQSVCVGIGGDPFVGTSFTDLCKLVRHDPDTKAVVILGEIGGKAEEELGQYMQESGFELPVFGFIAGRTAPPGKRLGHAGAILEKGAGGIEVKLQAMADSGFHLIDDLDQIAGAVAQVL